MRSVKKWFSETNETIPGYDGGTNRPKNGRIYEMREVFGFWKIFNRIIKKKIIITIRISLLF